MNGRLHKYESSKKHAETTGVIALRQSFMKTIEKQRQPYILRMENASENVLQTQFLLFS